MYCLVWRLTDTIVVSWFIRFEQSGRLKSPRWDLPISLRATGIWKKFTVGKQTLLNFPCRHGSGSIVCRRLCSSSISVILTVYVETWPHETRVSFISTTVCRARSHQLVQTEFVLRNPPKLAPIITALLNFSAGQRWNNRLGNCLVTQKAMA